MATKAVEKVLTAEKEADEKVRLAEQQGSERVAAAEAAAEREMRGALEKADAAVKEKQIETRHKVEDIHQGQRLLTEQKLREMKEETARKKQDAVGACLDAIR